MSAVVIVQEERYEEAASATFTYYVTHQDDERLAESLEFYRSLEGGDKLHFQDLERHAYQVNLGQLLWRPALAVIISFNLL